ncbi:MAG TPA: DsbA family protein, partial [Blastocatellia bacterium]
MKRYLPFVIIAVVLVAAVSAGYLMFRSPQPQTLTLPPPPSGSGASPGAQVSKGAVVIDEFGDYQCPPCGLLHPVLRTLKSEYGDRIQFNFHQFPLTQLHNLALEAAYAATAASLQGKFWQMHDLLYDNQSTWS